MRIWHLIGVVAVVIAWLIFRRIFLTPAEREFEELRRQGLAEAAKRRNGKVTGYSAQRKLTITHESTPVELSFVERIEEPSSDYTYARFQTDSFTDKKFNVVLNSNDFFKKPLVIGTRITIDDERFADKFIVTGNDPNFTNKVLNEEIRARLLRDSLNVKFGRRTDSSRLSREKGWLTVFVSGTASDKATFEQLIETAILFRERFASLSAA
jgi:hypothetical protein